MAAAHDAIMKAVEFMQRDVRDDIDRAIGDALLHGVGVTRDGHRITLTDLWKVDLVPPPQP